MSRTTRKRSRFGLRVRVDGQWRDTACRFDPDSYDTAKSFGERGIEDGLIEDFEVVLNLPKSRYACREISDL